MHISISAPGKLFISGEWSVLEPGNSSIVAAINRRVSVDIETLSGGYISVYAEDFKLRDIRLRFDSHSVRYITNLDDAEKEKLKFLIAAIEIALKYLKEKFGSIKTFKLSTKSKDLSIEIDGEQRKIGFGSSAAITVAAIGGILELHGLSLTHHLEQIYKLAAIAHYNAQGKIGSCFDIAASTYGGIFHYVAPDINEVINMIQSNSIVAVVENSWPLLHIEKLPQLTDICIGICWTKSVASTVEMVKQMNYWKSSNKEEYDIIIKKIAQTTENIITKWKAKDKEKIIQLLRKNEDLLRELGKVSCIPIETPDLKKLSDIANSMGASGKLSGAGGGDCGIAICFDEETNEKIKLGWKEAGLWPLDVELDKEHVRVEK